MKPHVSLALAVVLLSSAAAVAQAPLLADLVELRRIRAIIPADTAREFAAIAGPTPDQAVAATALIDAARDVERRMLADLRSLMDEAQLAAVERFERAHRRSLYAACETLAVPFDLVRFLRSLRVDLANPPELADALARYETDGDRALIAYAQAVKANAEFAQLRFDGSPEMNARSSELRNELVQTSIVLDRLLKQTLDRVLPILPPEAGDLLAFATAAGGLEILDLSLNPATTPVVREVLSLDLSSSQRARIDAAVAGAERMMLDRARQYTREEADFTRLSSEAQQARRSRNDTPRNVFVSEIGAMQRRLNAEVLSVLTVDQRAQYDALPVRDRPRTSPILDEGETYRWWK